MYPAGRQGPRYTTGVPRAVPGVDGPDGPSVRPPSTLQEDEGLALGEGLSKKGSKTDAFDGSGSHLSSSDTSKPAPGHRIYPIHLLKGVELIGSTRSGPRTSPTSPCFLYLVAIMDWHSRHVLAWKLSNTMDTGFCMAALEEALGKGRPEIFNTDQGAQFKGAEGPSAAWMVRVGTWTTSSSADQVRGGVSKSLPNCRRGPSGIDLTWSSTTSRGLTRLWATGLQPRYTKMARKKVSTRSRTAIRHGETALQFASKMGICDHGRDFLSERSGL